MADSGGRQYQKLPPGWDCKYDQTTGNCYYINYITKAMQLEDPRSSRYRPLQNERCSNESIAMHSFNGPGGSPYHVYPTNNMPAVRAFQTPNSSLHHTSTSPLLTSSRTQLISETSPIPAAKLQFAQAPRTVSMSRRSTIQETSFSNQIDTDAVVNKIQNMFPTASENHIRLLLKKYMKTIFPKADETLLLDVLANADNNVQKASEKLISLGYVKKDFAAPPKLSNRPQHDVADNNKQMAENGTKIIPLRPKEYTEDEKQSITKNLKEKYPQIADRIILMALESVNYAEDRAIQILQIVKEEDERQIQNIPQHKYPATLENQDEEFKKSEIISGRNSRHSHRDHSNIATEKLCKDFKSLIGRIPTNGPDASLAKGANEGLLLADYITWNGANPDFCQGQKNLAKGSDCLLRTESTYKVFGPNNELCKGPQTNLARGSIYKTQNTNSANKSIDIKCN